MNLAQQHIIMQYLVSIARETARYSRNCDS